jgi:hypothetical protein
MAQLVKTIQGLAIASCKTTAGLAIASAKTIMGVDNTGSASYTLLYNATTASLFEFNVGDVDNSTYIGWSAFDPGASRDIGKIEFKMSLKTGSITGKTFTARIWSMSGTALNVNLASSAGVTGDDAWSATLVPFIFTPYTISSGTSYAITLDAGGFDGSNYAVGYYNSTGGMPSPLPAAMTWWRGDKTQTGSNGTGFNTEGKVYTSP